MVSSRQFLAAVAALSLNVAAQTPQDFMPGSLVKLGVAYPSLNVDPAGTQVDSLQCKPHSFLFQSANVY